MQKETGGHLTLSGKKGAAPGEILVSRLFTEDTHQGTPGEGDEGG